MVVDITLRAIAPAALRYGGIPQSGGERKFIGYSYLREQWDARAGCGEKVDNNLSIFYYPVSDARRCHRDNLVRTGGGCHFAGRRNEGEQTHPEDIVATQLHAAGE